MGDRLWFSFSITPPRPKPVLLLVGPCIPAPSLVSASVLRQPVGTPTQKHIPLTVYPPIAGEGAQREHVASKSRTVAAHLCTVVKLPLLQLPL